jgi:excisionase family DNA binding protein
MILHMKEQHAPPIPNPTEWLTLAGAAFLLGVHKTTVTRMARAGVLTGYRPYGAPKERRAVMFWRAEVNKVLDARITLATTKSDAR